MAFVRLRFTGSGSLATSYWPLGTRNVSRETWGQVGKVSEGSQVIVSRMGYYHLSRFRFLSPL